VANVCFWHKADIPDHSIELPVNFFALADEVIE